MIAVASAVVILVSLLSWWYWPRGDARFVGKWEWWMGSPPSLRSIWRFNANGSGVVRDPTGKQANLFPWAVKGDRLLIGYRSALADDLLARIDLIAQPVVGGEIFYTGPSYTYRIVSFSDQTIELETDAYLEKPVLTRIPE